MLLPSPCLPRLGLVASTTVASVPGSEPVVMDALALPRATERRAFALTEAGNAPTASGRIMATRHVIILNGDFGAAVAS